MAHEVLLGDSVFDNARYVPKSTEVQVHLRQRLGAVHRVTLLAQDGAVLANVPAQLKEIKGSRDGGGGRTGAQFAVTRRRNAYSAAPSTSRWKCGNSST